MRVFSSNTKQYGGRPFGFQDFRKVTVKRQSKPFVVDKSSRLALNRLCKNFLYISGTARSRKYKIRFVQRLL